VLFEARGRFGVYDENDPDDHTDENHPLLLAFRGDIAGVVRLDRGSSDVGIIRQFAIDGPSQGVGHGRMLLQMLVAREMALGLRVLEVNSDGQAVGFYQRFGFNLVVGEREIPCCGSLSASQILAGLLVKSTVRSRSTAKWRSETLVRRVVANSLLRDLCLRIRYGEASKLPR
jgi:N-acetylglutamate synthase-like GNAT family acetyltransferase